MFRCRSLTLNLDSCNPAKPMWVRGRMPDLDSEIPRKGGNAGVEQTSKYRYRPLANFSNCLISRPVKE